MLSQIGIRRKFQENSEAIGLPSLLGKTSHCSCSDPRDVVYGILGLATDFDRAYLLPDYTLSRNQLGVTLVKYIMDCQKDLWILSLPHLGFGSSTPSWAPKFDNISVGYNMLSSLIAFQGEFSVSERSQIAVRFCSNLQIMSIQGQSSERIEEVAIQLPGTDAFSLGISSAIKIIARALQTTIVWTKTTKDSLRMDRQIAYKGGTS